MVQGRFQWQFDWEYECDGAHRNGCVTKNHRAVRRIDQVQPLLYIKMIVECPNNTQSINMVP